jgi:UDP-N-acetylmuramoyl-tripeptide--D-alanyl-D-alanine ligase
VDEIRLTAEWVAHAVDGRVARGDLARRFDSVSIDTRSLAAGALYFAIRGERFDGADFAADAIARGAAGLVLPRGRGTQVATGGDVVIEVDDTTRALQSLARAVRFESGTRVVAITGSAGKTTTKEITAEFLAARYRVMRNRGNFNNHIGLPLSLMELTGRPEISVVELGMNHSGEISTLVGIAEPDVRVWTNVGEAHLGFFESVDAIADAKAEILERATPATVLVANADDDRIAARVESFAGRLVRFGIDREADVRAQDVTDRGIGGMAARVTTRRGDMELTTQLVGVANLANILAATAVALEFDVPVDELQARAARLRPAPHRGEVLRLGAGVTLIDDSYNANPAATERALQVLRRSPATRRIAILGEMLELGERAPALHERVGRAAASAGVDRLVAVGGRPAQAMAEAAAAAGIPRGAVEHFATSEEAADRAAALVVPGDLVLVKGSRGVRTDRIVDRLKAERG